MSVDTGERLDPATLLALTDLLVEFAYSVDFDNGMSTAELFTEDGYYESDGQRSTGRAAIHQAYVSRAARGIRTSRHVFTNMRFRRDGHGRLVGRSIMLLFAQDGPAPHPAEPLLVADVDDVYEFHAGQPRIAARSLRTVFIRPGATPVLPLGQNSADGAA
jgi:hypothetical protein